jgi:hypothetical protein
MKVFNDINSQGIFYFNGFELPGVLVTKANNPIEVKIVTNYKLSNIAKTEIEIFDNKPQRISLIYGVLKSDNKKVTLVDAMFYASSWSSNNLYEYTIITNLMVLGEFIDDINEFRIDNVALIISALNKLIGNTLLSARKQIKENVWHFDIINSKDIDFGKEDGIKIILKAFYNFEMYSRRSSFTIEQKNSIEFTFDPPKKLYDIIGFVRTIENYFSFVFQTELGIDEVAYLGLEKYEDRTIELINHIYYNDEDKTNNKVDIDRYLINDDKIEENIGLHLFNWIRLTNNIEYLNYFIRLYYGNKYIDQKIIAQINMLEALHRFYYGTKRSDSDNNDLIENICSELKTDTYKELVTGLLKQKNSFGLNRKIKELADKAGCPIVDKQIVKDINNLRQQYSHGSKNKDTNIQKLRTINEFLMNIINSLILSEVKSMIKKAEL